MWMILLCVLLSATQAHAAGRVFFDGFEDGTHDAWVDDADHPDCVIVTTASDAVLGPYAGTYMASCNYSVSDYQSFGSPAPSYTNELFVRIRVRVDTDADETVGASMKMLRFYDTSSGESNWRDMITNFENVAGLLNQCVVDSYTCDTYWGTASGD